MPRHGPDGLHHNAQLWAVTLAGAIVAQHYHSIVARRPRRAFSGRGAGNHTKAFTHAEYMVMVVLAACLSLLADPAAVRAEKCPAGDEPIFPEDLQATSDCLSAHALHEQCAWGSGGDAELSGAVIEKCEAVFLQHLRRSQLRLYRRRGARCDAAYDHRYSMGPFQASMCREDLAVLYYRAFSRGPGQASPKWPGPAPTEE